jgi:hypothetical protein
MNNTKHKEGNMARHTVNFKDFKGYVIKDELVGSYGGGVDKTLELRTEIMKDGSVTYNYVVLNHRKPVYEGESLKDAVDLYNLL